MESAKIVPNELTEKVTTGGISKAEARAKRKEAKKQQKGKKDDKQSNVQQATLPKSEKKINTDLTPYKNEAESKSKTEERKASIELAVDEEYKSKSEVNKRTKLTDVAGEKNLHTSSAKPSGDIPGLSKSELKAQRRAKQESQRLAKDAAKAQTSENARNIDKKENCALNLSSENAESKAELKAKRRAIQEAQRQAKTNEKVKIQIQATSEKITEPVKLKKALHLPDTMATVQGSNANKKLQLFHHLYSQYNSQKLKELSFTLHSSIIRLGAQYMSHTVLGSNARCLALLSAIKNLVTDFRTPPQQEFCRSLETTLQHSADYLNKCRPPAVSMMNALRHINLHLTQIRDNVSDQEKKTSLLNSIDNYIRDEIDTADKAISLMVQEKISNGDVILTYACSSIVTKILLDAHNKGNGKSFKVIVVDSRPLLEGREMLRKLVNAGIKCSYVLINAISFIMGKATKVLLGAHSLLANGYVMSRMGTAQVALTAQTYNKPVLVCCETYKFCERVQTDSIVHNEIGDPNQLINRNNVNEESPLKNWQNSKYIAPLNLMYDVTPSDLVTAVVTELAILPCTSVPVVLRVKPTEMITQ